MKKRTLLPETAVILLKTLKSRGCRISFLSRYAQIEYDTHRTTVYRHLSENSAAYEWKTKHTARRERDRRVCELFACGMNTQKISGTIKMNLTQVNRIAIRCRKEFPELWKNNN